MNMLYERYKQSKKELMKEFGYKNELQVPRLVKVVLNVGVKEALKDKKSLTSASEALVAISGQRPVITTAKKSIAGFKLRAGDAIGVSVTLRGNKMYDFLEKLFTIVLPRVRDFRGLRPSAFDGQGNYTLGLSEFIVFSEIDYNKLDKTKGLGISIVTTAQTDDEGRALLRLLGMPFSKDTH